MRARRGSGMHSCFPLKTRTNVVKYHNLILYYPTQDIGIAFGDVSSDIKARGRGSSPCGNAGVLAVTDI
jgi:hypothetical protein